MFRFDATGYPKLVGIRPCSGVRSQGFDAESQHLRGLLRHARGYGVQQRANPVQLLRGWLSLVAVEILNHRSMRREANVRTPSFESARASSRKTGASHFGASTNTRSRFGGGVEVHRESRNSHQPCAIRV